MDPSTTEMMKDYLSVQKTRMTVEKSHDITASRTQKQKPGDHCCRCQSQAEAQQEAIEVPHRPWQLWHFISESGGMIATNAEAIWIWLTGHVAVREASSMACSDFSFKKNGSLGVTLGATGAGEDVPLDSHQTQRNQTQHLVHHEMHYLFTDCCLQLGVACFVQKNIWE